MGPFTETASEVLLALPPDRSAARRARRALHEARVPEDLEHTVSLLTTELIANALRHAGLADDQHIVFAARFVTDFIRVEIRDPGPGFDPGAVTSGRGYGLRIVAALATRWGVDGIDGTRVWFEIDRRTGRFNRGAANG